MFIIQEYQINCCQVEIEVIDKTGTISGIVFGKVDEQLLSRKAKEVMDESTQV